MLTVRVSENIQKTSLRKITYCMLHTATHKTLHDVMMRHKRVIDHCRPENLGNINCKVFYSVFTISARVYVSPGKLYSV